MKKEIEKLPYFTLSQLSLFTKNKKVALVYISRWLKNGFIKNESLVEFFRISWKKILIDKIKEL